MCCSLNYCFNKKPFHRLRAVYVPKRLTSGALRSPTWRQLLTVNAGSTDKVRVIIATVRGDGHRWVMPPRPQCLRHPTSTPTVSASCLALGACATSRLVCDPPSCWKPAFSGGPFRAAWPTSATAFPGSCSTAGALGIADPRGAPRCLEAGGNRAQLMRILDLVLSDWAPPARKTGQRPGANLFESARGAAAGSCPGFRNSFRQRHLRLVAIWHGAEGRPVAITPQREAEKLEKGWVAIYLSDHSAFNAALGADFAAASPRSACQPGGAGRQIPA